MSHYIAEIVMPQPAGELKVAVDQVMRSFCDTDDNGKPQSADWWDWYLIGGRFSGHKIEAKIGKKRIKEFHDRLKSMKVTVSNFQAGKPSLMPVSWIPIVDGIWREMFPGYGDKCLLFEHSRDQYGKEGLYADDVCLVKDVPHELDCDRLIIADSRWNEEDHSGEVEPKYMLVKSFWNGKTWQNTDFDGCVVGGLDRARDYLSRTDIGDDWICVTVDYHD